MHATLTLLSSGDATRVLQFCGMHIFRRTFAKRGRVATPFAWNSGVFVFNALSK